MLDEIEDFMDEQMDISGRFPRDWLSEFFANNSEYRPRYLANKKDNNWCHLESVLIRREDVFYISFMRDF